MAEPRSVANSIVSSIVRPRSSNACMKTRTTSRPSAGSRPAERQALTGSPPPPEAEDGRVYDNALLSAVLWTYPAYSQNYLFSAMTEAWMWDAISSSLGNPIGNAKVGPLITSKLIQAETDLPASLSAMKPGARTAALKDYLSRIHPGE